jgi:hypothetical protein
MVFLGPAVGVALPVTPVGATSVYTDNNIFKIPDFEKKPVACQDSHDYTFFFRVNCISMDNSKLSP